MVNFGIIGAGRIAETFANSLNGIGGNLAGIASRNIEKAEAFKKQFNVTKAYGSYQAMYADPAIDCIYVATPHGLHFEQMNEILDYKKHILCEKAFTLNRKQAEQIFNKANTNQCFVMEAMWTRFLPTIQDVKRRIEDGVIGEVKTVEAAFSIEAVRDDSDRLYNKQLGGGALLDVGIYPITIANIILGPPEKITSDMTPYQKTGVDYYETINFTYPNASATLVAGFNKNLPIEATIEGTKGSIHIPLFWSSEKAYIHDQNDHVVETIEHKHIVNGFEYQIQEVIKCIENNQLESKIMPHKTSLEILEQMDFLRQSWHLSYPNE